MLLLVMLDVSEHEVSSPIKIEAVLFVWLNFVDNQNSESPLKIPVPLNSYHRRNLDLEVVVSFSFEL